MYRGYDNEATWAYASYFRNDLKAYRKYRIIARNLRLRYGEENLLNEFTKALILQKDRFTSQEKSENPYLKRIHEDDWEKIDYPAVAAAFIGQQV
ncbi:MAG: hypothetical protein ACFNYI_07380 [Eubacterium sp.]